MNTITDLSVMAPDPAEAGANLQKTLIRSNSKSIIWFFSIFKPQIVSRVIFMPRPWPWWSYNGHEGQLTDLGWKRKIYERNNF